MRHTLLPRVIWGVAVLAGAGALAVTQAAAQIPNPPSTVFGSVTDSEGPVDENLPVEAYIGDKLCGEGYTGFTGDGDARVTVYFAEVVSDSQEAGCGQPGAEVRIKIGDRFADVTYEWEAGPVRLDITFGDATPAPIPTFTPTPTRTPTPADEGTQEPGSDSTPPTEDEETIPPGSPGAGSPVSRGGVTSGENASSNGGGDDGGGGFPIWAVAIFVLGGIAAVGGGVGFVMSRNRDEEDDFYPRAPVE